MLVALADYKQFKNDTTTTKDGYYTFLLGLVDEFVKTYVQQKLEQQISIIEYYAMRTIEYFVLNQRPVIQIRNLWYDPNGEYGQLSGSFDVVNSLLVVGVDYFLKIDNPVSVNSVNATWKSRSGLVYLLGGQGQGQWRRRQNYLNSVLTPSWGTIKVEYDAGYPIIPQDLVLGVCMMVRVLERIIPYGGVGMAMTESTQKYSYSLMQMLHSDMGFERLLARYKGLGLSI